MKTKIANAEQMKVHTMLAIGNRDMEASAVSLRVHGKGNHVALYPATSKEVRNLWSVDRLELPAG